MKYYIIAGEASGDLHGSNLVKEIRKLDATAEFRCWGGDKMQAEGCHIVKHISELAFMGFVEVLMNIRQIHRNLEFCKSDIEKHKPDALILIDYPGFNLRIAEFAKKINCKVIYYISPQVWAWKQSRVTKIKRTVDKMLVILPFEKDFYKKWNYEVEFVGHPLLDALGNETGDALTLPELGDKPIVALLPGSRKQEISKILPEMLKVVRHFPEYTFAIAGAPHIEEGFYANIIGKEKVRVVSNQTYPLLKKSKAALVTSGTATLETALIGVPEIVCYKANALSVAIARYLIKVEFISLVNLILSKALIKELVQGDLNENNLVAELKTLLENNSERKRIQEGYTELREKLGGAGASARAAKIVWSTISAKIKS